MFKKKALLICLMALLTFIWSAVFLSFLPLRSTQINQHKLNHLEFINIDLEHHSYEDHGVSALCHSHTHLIALPHHLMPFMLAIISKKNFTIESVMQPIKMRHTRLFRPPIKVN